jgi:hypothetical protein
LPFSASLSTNSPFVMSASPLKQLLTIKNMSWGYIRHRLIVCQDKIVGRLKSH